MSEPQWMDQPLPSEGRFYGPDALFPTPELPDGVVPIRSFSFREEELMATSGARGAQRVRSVVQNCSKLPDGFTQDMLLVTDQMALLLYQRIISLGSALRVPWHCEACSAANMDTVDLAEALNDRHPADVQKLMHEAYPDLYADRSAFPLQEPFEHIVAGVRVGLRYLRVRDEREIEQQVRRAQAQSDGPGGREDPGFTERRIRRIASLDGNDKVSYSDKEDFVTRLSYRDGRSLHNFVNKADTGIDQRVLLTCRACGLDQSVTIGFGTEFFWPSDV